MTAALVGVSSFNMVPAIAQQLEEIIVTAQKREQSLEDVPISVSALDGDVIQQNGMSQIKDLSIMVPNLNIGESPGEYTINIRGIGSATSNRAFEQSVGLYVDGVYTGRSKQFQAPFLDVARVEVVRGPQGVLFGKNSNAGAVSVTSNRPTSELAGKVRASYEVENSGWGVEGLINFPITDDLAVRIAAMSEEQGDFIDNSAPGGGNGGDKDLDAIKASILWTPTDALQIYAKIDHAKTEWNGSTFQVLEFGDGGAEGFYKSKDPLSEDRFDLNQQQDGDYINGGGTINDVDSNTYVLQADWTTAGHIFTYIGAYSEYTSELGLDADFGNFPALFSGGGDDFEQTSHEFRITSNGDGRLEYLAGVFFLDRDYLIPDWKFHANFAELPPPLPPLTRQRSYDENTESASVFFQGTYQITDSLSATLGLRYGEEEKKAISMQSATHLNDPDNPFPGGIGPFPEYVFEGDRDEDSLTPSFSLQYAVNDDANVYFSYNEAEKSGGFNSNSAQPTGIEYDTESAAGFEIGLKSMLSDGAVRLNVAVFSTEFDDYQVSSYDGVSQTVNNAATTITRGVELEVDWAATDKLTIGAALAYLDAEYDDFPNAPCAPINQSDCVDGNYRDASGERITFAPEYSGSIYGNYIQPIGNDLELRVRLTGNFSDEYDTQIDKSEYQVAESYFLVNARMGIGRQDGSWQLALVGSNLTDERLYNFTVNMPFFAGAHVANTMQPRKLSVEATYQF
ncbi:MAG: TonB-dependent receptor [Halioglobus sp.]